jgi:hypothetical protein
MIGVPEIDTFPQSLVGKGAQALLGAKVHLAARGKNSGPIACAR